MQKNTCNRMGADLPAEQIQSRIDTLHRHQALLEEIQAEETSERALRGIEETLKRVVHEIAALYVARQNLTEDAN